MMSAKKKKVKKEQSEVQRQLQLHKLFHPFLTHQAKLNQVSCSSESELGHYSIITEI